MRAEIKTIVSLDIDDLSNYVPKTDDFSFLLRVIVGPENSEGEESFDITVCTLQWLQKQLNHIDVMMGRHHLIVKDYDYEKILDAIYRYVESCEGDNWNEVALKLSCLGYWEFEDYRD